MIKDILTGKTMLFLALIIGVGYLASKFPEQSVLFCGLAAIIVIAIWIHQAVRDRTPGT